MTDPEIVPADPTLRRWVLIALAVVIPAGILLIQFFSGKLSDYKALAATDVDGAIAGIRELIRYLIGVNAAVTVAAAAYFLILARRVLRSGRFPPPGMRVIRDARIRRGRSARWLGRLLVLLAGVLLATNFFFIQVYRLVGGLV